MKWLENKNMHWRVRQIDRVIKRIDGNIRLKMDRSHTVPVDKLSMVVVGRNDNYGGDFSARVRATVEWHMKNIPNLELIYVEWNQLTDKPSDAEFFAKTYENSKSFIVPNNIHKLYNSTSKIPMMEYHAKNMGIRESSNDWVFLVNADVFLGLNAIENLKNLNPDTVYGTHYVNIEWDGKALSDKYMKDPQYTLAKFSTNRVLGAVVGNFILTHKKNWLQATGYDESKTDIRDGMDVNGMDQLLYFGAKTLILGDHYHLDHKESRIYGYNDTHGVSDARRAIIEKQNIPYKNPDDWGLQGFQKEQLAPRLWKVVE